MASRLSWSITRTHAAASELIKTMRVMPTTSRLLGDGLESCDTSHVWVELGVWGLDLGWAGGAWGFFRLASGRGNALEACQAPPWAFVLR